MPVLVDTLAYNYPWLPGYNPNWHNSVGQLWPRRFLLNWIEVPDQVRVPESPDRSQEKNEGPAALAGKPGESSEKNTVDETDTHTAPKYGGASPLNRYGIDYSTHRGRPRRTKYTGSPHAYTMPESTLQQ
ncbi:hypothetical protein MTO96_041271 [Rhipicephalus appendiculatus]